MTDIDFLELASERYSVRDFSPQTVEDEKIDLILRAASVAPTAVNFQLERLYVVKSEEGIQKLSAMRNMFGSQLAIIVCYDRTVSWKNTQDNGHDSGEVDAAIVATHIMLEAWNLGIGSCWIGSFSTLDVQTTFGISEKEVPVAIIALGYPAENCLPADKHYQSKDIDEFVKII